MMLFLGHHSRRRGVCLKRLVSWQPRRRRQRPHRISLFEAANPTKCRGGMAHIRCSSTSGSSRSVPSSVAKVGSLVEPVAARRAALRNFVSANNHHQHYKSIRSFESTVVRFGFGIGHQASCSSTMHGFRALSTTDTTSSDSGNNATDHDDDHHHHHQQHHHHHQQQQRLALVRARRDELATVVLDSQWWAETLALLEDVVTDRGKRHQRKHMKLQRGSGGGGAQPKYQYDAANTTGGSSQDLSLIHI